MTFGSDSWTVLSPLEISIKTKIETYGVPLKNWNVNIYRGILTGYNEAFIISGEKKDELIAADSKSAEIIRPILRGRDIKRYSYINSDLWLIATFPSKHYNIDDYPAVKAHLLGYGIERLEQTGKTHIVDGIKIKARKKTNNKWFETQDSISYWDDFSKPKIAYAETMRVHKGAIKERFPRFTFLTANTCLDKTCFMVTGDNLLYILAIINSNVSEYYIHKNVAVLDTGGFLMQKIYIENLPIPKAEQEVVDEILSLVRCVITPEASDQEKSQAQDQIDTWVCSLYGFTNEEIQYMRNVCTTHHRK